MVASAAGTSVGTVSNVLNHPERVRPALRERVENAMAELNYWPDATARAMTLGRSSIVGNVVFDVSNPFFAQFAHEIDRIVQRAGASAIVAGTEQRVDAELEALRNLAKVGVDGLMICTTGGCWDELARFQDRGVPVILYAQRSADERFASVGVDDRAGMRLVGEHLLERGMTRFCFVNEQREAMQHRDRYLGFLDALTTGGIAPETIDLRWSGDPSWAGGYAVAREVLRGPRSAWPECFVCLNDYTAMGVCRAIGEAGLRVGHDIAVTGFDDLPYASLLAAPLTTVRQPIADMATHAITELRSAIHRGDVAVSGKTFPPELILRESA